MADTSGIDRVGAACSAACAVHCGAVALAPGSLSAFGLGLLLGPVAEWAFTVAAAALAAAAAAVGFRKHRSRLVGTMFVVGILGLITGRLLEAVGGHDVGTMVGVLAALALIGGHLLNIRRAGRARSPAPPPSP